MPVETTAASMQSDAMKLREAPERNRFDKSAPFSQIDAQRIHTLREAGMLQTSTFKR